MARILIVENDLGVRQWVQEILFGANQGAVTVIDGLGNYPVIRGTALPLGDRSAYLWTSGFVPRLDTYMGPETPLTPSW
jgi:hypothetical protein